MSEIRCSYALFIEGVKYPLSQFPEFKWSGIFQSLSFTLFDNYIAIVNSIEWDGYVNATLVLRVIKGSVEEVENIHFIIDDYSLKETFEGVSCEFRGLSRTALTEERFSSVLSSGVTYTNVVELTNLLNDHMSGLGVLIEPLPPLYLDSLIFPVSNKSVADVLTELSNLTGMLVSTDPSGISLRFINNAYRTEEALNSSTLSYLSDIEEFTEERGEYSLYNAVTVVGAGEEGGNVILETKFEVSEPDGETHVLFVYTEPLISTFNSVTVTASDGEIFPVSVNETVVQEELLDFTDNKATLDYPVKTVRGVVWYNLPNTLLSTPGSREIAIEQPDDLCVAKITYETERNVYKLIRLTEPLVKVKVSVE